MKYHGTVVKNEYLRLLRQQQHCVYRQGGVAAGLELGRDGSDQVGSGQIGWGWVASGRVGSGGVVLGWIGLDWTRLGWVDDSYKYPPVRAPSASYLVQCVSPFRAFEEKHLHRKVMFTASSTADWKSYRTVSDVQQC